MAPEMDGSSGTYSSRKDAYNCPPRRPPGGNDTKKD